MEEKTVEFYTHGLHRIAERRLTTDMVRGIIKTGFRLTPREKNHEGVVRPYEGNGWRIFVKETKEKIIVITAYQI